MRGIVVKRSAILTALATAVLLCGCISGPESATSSITVGSRPEARGDVGTLTYRAVDRLVAEAPELGLGRPVVVGSIVEVQRVDRTTPFGNLVADLARTRLVQKGVVVSETRLRTTMLLDHKQGEMTLSHDRGSVVAPPSASGILTGTYATSDDLIYVSLKLVSLADAHIVSAVDFAVPRRGAETLLATGT
jgi:hypothetical protein